ncbi:MAG: aldo/keto reductase [Deltaproteobacteria bacterium]|jgi:predicted aldo/keto reductase-like oxidoreductase|nr:aldo/keto reductase [Deltaproteobacteria bacterium]
MIEKRTMGKTGDSSSILGFGCMRLPLKGPNPSDIDLELATKMLRAAIDRGVDYVDTAFPYHGDGGHFDTQGASEPFVGRALKDGYREKVKLATKLPTWLIKSHEDMHKYLDLQLKALETPYIDYYLAHNINYGVWEPMLKCRLFDFLDEAVKDGRIRYPAFSFHDDLSLFKVVLGSYDWAMTQLQYNYLDVNFQAGTEGVKLAFDKGVAVVVMEPLRGGYLTKYMPPEQEGVLKKERPDWSLAAWCLNWLWNQKEVGVVLSGMSDMSQVEDNLNSAENYSSGLFTAGDAEAVGKIQDYFLEKKIKVGCTSCGYCLPCPTGVDIPKNFTFLNQLYLFEAEEPKERTKYFYQMMLPEDKKAAKCVSCGECVEKCPQQIDIPSALKNVSIAFR